MGVESDRPIINHMSLKYDLTNEGGVNGKMIFLRNIMGLWLLQGCKRQWEKAGRKYSYEDLSRIASNSPALKSLVFVGNDRFLAPTNMVESIKSFCSETGQAIPKDDGEIVRCILESLALEYRWGKEKICELTGKTFSTIHIIGGGSRNQLLNQYTADATWCDVIAGPVEATAIGNILVQAIAMGYITTLSEGRNLVRDSFDMTYFHPQKTSPWDEAFYRYLNLRR
jgi:rhamnulokinase